MSIAFPRINQFQSIYSKINNMNFCTKSENELKLIEKLIPFKKMNLESLTKPSQLFHIKEFIQGFLDMHENKLKEAENYFQKLKENLRETHVSTYPYSLIIRRLGIVKLQQNKIKEGLIEIENFFEFSNLESHNPEYKFNAILDLIKTYIYYDSSKVNYIIKIGLLFC